MTDAVNRTDRCKFKYCPFSLDIARSSGVTPEVAARRKLRMFPPRLMPTVQALQRSPVSILTALLLEIKESAHIEILPYWPAEYPPGSGQLLSTGKPNLVSGPFARSLLQSGGADLVDLELQHRMREAMTTPDHD